MIGLITFSVIVCAAALLSYLGLYSLGKKDECNQVYI